MLRVPSATCPDCGRPVEGFFVGRKIGDRLYRVSSEFPCSCGCRFGGEYTRLMQEPMRGEIDHYIEPVQTEEQVA